MDPLTDAKIDDSIKVASSFLPDGHALIFGLNKGGITCIRVNVGRMVGGPAPQLPNAPPTISIPSLGPPNIPLIGLTLKLGLRGGKALPKSQFQEDPLDSM